jgi:hypothetical protein
MKNKIIIVGVIVSMALAGWGILRFRAERARHAMESARQSAQVVAMQTARDRIAAEYVAKERMLTADVELARMKAAALQRDIDSRPKYRTQAEVDKMRADVNQTWEEKFTLLQVDYYTALDRIDLDGKLIFTLRQQIAEQATLIDTQVDHIADLDKLIGTVQVDLTKAIADKYILQNQLGKSRMWGTVKTVGLGAVVVWAVLQAVKK